jgi:VanZ family protein
MTFSLVKAARFTGWFLASVITLLSLVPPVLRPETGVPHEVEHFTIFFATGLAFGFGYPRRPLAVAILLIVFAGIIELAQLFVPGRHARLTDFVVDALALCGGAAISFVLAARRLKKV